MSKYPSVTRRDSSVVKAKTGFEQAKIKSAWLAGRIVGILPDGFVLQDDSGRIDIQYEKTSDENIGDIVEVEVGYETKKIKGEEIKVYTAKDFSILAPCESEFFISKKSPNYKKQIIDLNLKENLKKRAEILDGIRKFFKKRDFLEVETPQLVGLPGMEPNIEVFKTKFEHYSKGPKDMYLTTSPEYAMKKLLTAGHEKIFQICRSYRNRETGGNYNNPEFTMLEWYRAYEDYTKVMEDMEELVRELAGGKKIKFISYEVDISVPFERMKVKDAFKKYADISEEELLDRDKFIKAVEKRNLFMDLRKARYEEIFYRIFLRNIEWELGISRPTILYEYPAQLCALAKKCEGNPAYVERFETYIAGVEICNAFTELNDPVEQQERLEHERVEREKMGLSLYDVDKSFIEALKFGMPPSAGIALGVDRLMMLLLGVEDIKNILYFPHDDL